MTGKKAQLPAQWEDCVMKHARRWLALLAVYVVTACSEADRVEQNASTSFFANADTSYASRFTFQSGNRVFARQFLALISDCAGESRVFKRTVENIPAHSPTKVEERVDILIGQPYRPDRVYGIDSFAPALFVDLADIERFKSSDAVRNANPQRPDTPRCAVLGHEIAEELRYRQSWTIYRYDNFDDAKEARAPAHKHGVAVENDIAFEYGHRGTADDRLTVSDIAELRMTSSALR